MNTFFPNLRIYEFDAFRLDSNEQELRRGGERISLTPKAVELLTVLVESRGQIVTREDILNNLWPDTYVDESNLTVTISMLRRALGVGSGDKHFIETVPKRGYRFNATVRTQDDLIVERHSLTKISIKEVEATGPVRDRMTALGIISPGRRFSTAFISLIVLASLAMAIHGWLGGQLKPSFLITEAKPSRTIAVLPFTVSGSRLGMVNTAHSLSNAIANDLAVGTQIVAPSTMNAEGATIYNFLIVGNKLQADAVLVGTVFDSSADIHIRIHLVSTTNGNVLWARTFRVPIDAAPGLSDEIVENVIGNLPRISAPLRPNEQTGSSTENREAQILYIQGRFIWRNRYGVFGGEAESKEHLDAALRLDPNFALPMIALADWQKVDRNNTEYLKQAEDNLQRALEISPRSADAHASLGFIRLVHDWNWTGAEREFKTALEIDPKCVNALQWYALLDALRERHKEAGQKITLAIQHDPFSVVLKRDAAELAYLHRNYGAALALARNVEFEVPGSASEIITNSLWLKGDHALASEYLVANSDDTIGREQFAARLNEEGPNGIARLLGEGLSRNKKYDFFPSYWQAKWFAYSNEREKALDLLERASDEHHFFMIWIKADPFFENLRDEPRYHNLLRRIGLDN